MLQLIDSVLGGPVPELTGYAARPNVGMRGRVERLVVFATLTALEAAGWHLESLSDGDATDPVTTIVEAMSKAFNLDECRIFFRRDDESACIFCVFGNGWECISDYHTILEPALAKVNERVAQLSREARI